MNRFSPRARRFAATLLAGFAIAAAAANAAIPQPSAPATERTPPKPLLWKVSDGDNAVYLLGSFHLLKAEDYPLSADIESAFADAEALVFEVPPEDLRDPAVATKMMQVAGYADGGKLSTALPAPVHARLGQLLGADRLAQVDAYEPWFINLSLLIGVSQGLGFKQDQGLDQHLMQRAKAANKPTAGLETVDQQLGLLDSTPMAEQIAGLQEFLDNPAAMPQQLLDMHAAWRNADLARLNALAIDEMREKTPETYRLINVQRNDAWVPQLRGMLDGVKDRDTLVVVGAMHLLGDDGVVEKLRGKGYKLERICTGCAGKK